MWNAFSKIRLDTQEVPYVQCNTCRRVMSYKQYTGTGSLRRHAATHQLPLGVLHSGSVGAVGAPTCALLATQAGIVAASMVSHNVSGENSRPGSGGTAARLLPAIRIEAPEQQSSCMAQQGSSSEETDQSSSEDSAPKRDTASALLSPPSACTH